MRESVTRPQELSFIQRVMQDFSAFFDCTRAGCMNGSVRQSVHELTICSETQLGMLTPMIFESFQT